jgi:hypothetical protein
MGRTQKRAFLQLSPTSLKHILRPTLELENFEISQSPMQSSCRHCCTGLYIATGEDATDIDVLILEKERRGHDNSDHKEGSLLKKAKMNKAATPTNGLIRLSSCGLPLSCQ